MDKYRKGRLIKYIIEFTYKGKTYEVRDEMDYRNLDFEIKDWDIYDDDNLLHFWWEEGNGSCDCNRSSRIHDKLDSDFPELMCGHEINYEGLEILEIVD